MLFVFHYTNSVMWGGRDGKNKKSVPSRVFSSVVSIGEPTGQERRFHGCLSTVVNSIFGEEVSRSELYRKMRSSK